MALTVSSVLDIVLCLLPSLGICCRKSGKAIHNPEPS